MKVRIIPATTERQRLIQSIVKDLKNKEPHTNRIEYYYTLKGKKRGSSYLSEEQNGIFRDVSILHVNYSKTLFQGIEAVMGNKTGRVFLERKPVFMTARRALKKLDEFLRKLQPENLENPKYGIASVKVSNSGEETQRDLTFDGYKINKHTISSKSMQIGGPKEVNPIFTKL